MSYKPPQCVKCKSTAYKFDWPCATLCTACLEGGPNWGKDRIKIRNSEKFFK